MQAVLTQTYCAFCESVSNFITKVSGITDSINRARTAYILAEMGYYDEAKRSMLDD